MITVATLLLAWVGVSLLLGSTWAALRWSPGRAELPEPSAAPLGVALPAQRALREEPAARRDDVPTV